MIYKWFVGTFCPNGATCTEKGGITPTNGPILRKMEIDQQGHFLGEVQQFFNKQSFVDANANPVNWARCEGQLLAISTKYELFSLCGTNYGGDGRVVFGLPDFRKTDIHNLYININGLIPKPTKVE